MVVYEKIYFKAYTNDLCISYKNNIAQLYFILGRAELRWNFSSILKDILIFTDFPTGSDLLFSYREVFVKATQNFHQYLLKLPHSN